MATLAVLLLGTLFAGTASATITVQPITWNIIGLDSNNVNTGPNRFPGGARVCTDATPSNGSVTVTWNWTSSDPFIDLRVGSQNPVILAPLAANSCADAYFEIEIVRNSAAYNHTRSYRIDADDADPGVSSSPVPREMLVEHLISQSRNSISDIQYGTSIPGLTSVAAGGALNLVVGNTYFIRLIGGTATQGYEQLETFIGFKNTVFRVLDVDSTFPADTSATVSSPTDTLYLDGCVWENDTNSPNYLSCLSTGKAGGSPVAITYQVQIISGGGTTETLNSLFHDFSGSSYHYNADYSSSARFANILDPTTSTISKSFTPSTIPVNGTSTLSFVIGNPNAFSVSGYSLIDNLPAGVVVATPVTTSTSGCGTAPTFAPTAGATTLSFSNGTVGAGSSCTFTVQVTSAATGTYDNTTEFLLIDGISTTRTASASLVVNNMPAPPACTNGLELATWRMEPAAGTATPPLFTFKSSLASSATASYSGTGTESISTLARTGAAVNYWQVTGGWPANATGFPNPAAPYFEFVLDTTNFTAARIAFDYKVDDNWANAANNHLYVYSSANGGAFTNLSDTSGFTKNDPFVNRADNAATTGSSTTTFRINVVGQQQNTAQFLLDNIVITGCAVPRQPPLTKAFSPTTIAVNGTSTLTFTLGNENNIALTGAGFTDALPTGIQVAATPSVTSTCGAWSPAPVAGATTLTFTGGTIPARVGTTNGSCTLSVNVTATSAGSRTNISGPISTTQTGTNSGPTGFGTASLTAISPPVIAKQFSPSTVLTGGVSTLTFTITNPNPSNAIAGVAFSDTFPVAPGAMVVAATPAPNNTCSPLGTWTTTPGAASVSLTGAGVPAGGSCTVRVNVLAPSPAVGTYNNTSGNVSHLVNGVSINGNTATASLLVNPASPSISLLKQVSTSALGPWFSYLAVPLGAPLFYQFTVENTGDVALVMPASPGYVTDVSVPGPNVDTASCFAGWTSPLPVAVSANDNHIDACVVGPIAAVASGVVNTGTASSPTGPSTDTSVASYGITGIALDKTADVSIYGFVGQVISYSFLVTNTGNAVLSGPVVISDNLTSNESCPALSTIGDFDNFFDPGEAITCSATYTIVQADATAGSVNNVATASAGGATSAPDNVTITYSPPVLNVTKSVNPNPVSIGEQATYTITITNTGLVNTSADITIADTLPEFITFVSASGTDWTCDGLIPLSCTFSGRLSANGGSTSLDLLVDVGVGTVNGNNTARASGGGDPFCPAAPDAALARCSGTVIVGTVPVIFSDISVQVENAALVVRFGTASEDGALGFRVHAGRADSAARHPLVATLSLAQASILAPQHYEIRGSYSGQTRVWIEEVSILGESTFHGPFVVGTRVGEAQTGFVATDWSSIRSEQTALRHARGIDLSARLARAGTPAEAELRISQSGWVRVRYEDLLSQGVDWNGVPAAQIELSRGTESMPLKFEGGAVFGPGGSLAFLAESISGSLYTQTAVYRLRVAQAGAALPTVFAGSGNLPAKTGVSDRFEHAPNRQYNAAADGADPWFAQRLVRNGVPMASVSETFVLPEKSASSRNERIEVELFGGLNYPTDPDHSVKLRLNGVHIASAHFDGVTRKVIQANLGQGILVSGNNTLTIELWDDTGLPADVVYLEAIRIDYARRLHAVDERIAFAIAQDSGSVRVGADRVFVDDFDNEGSIACTIVSECSAYRITGFSGNDGVVLRQRNGDTVQLAANIVATSDGNEVRFASTTMAGDRFWVEPAAGSVNANVTLAAPAADPLAGGPASYLIVSHPSFLDGLAPLIAAREAEGFAVRVVDVDDLYAFYNDGVVDPVAIQLALADAYARLGTRYVLLVGGDTLDYFNYGGANSISFIPTPYRVTSQFIRFGAADGSYADIDSDGLADLAIGRFPVRTLSELDVLISKTLSYPLADHRGKALLVSDRDQGEMVYSAQLAPIGNYLGNSWNVSGLTLQNYAAGGASQARADLVTAVDSGQSLLAFLGHASPGNWTFEGLLTAGHVYGGAFSNATKPTLVWNLGCYGAYFVDPYYNTIAHGMLLQGNGGAAAVVGASGLTDVSSDVAWVNTLGPVLGAVRLGDALRISQRLLYQSGPEFRDISTGGVLLGDPALRLNQ